MRDSANPSQVMWETAIFFDYNCIYRISSLTSLLLIQKFLNKTKLSLLLLNNSRKKEAENNYNENKQRLLKTISKLGTE